MIPRAIYPTLISLGISWTESRRTKASFGFVMLQHRYAEVEIEYIWHIMDR